MGVGGLLPYEMYTRVNLSGVNGFLNVRESQGMIKERSVIHCPHDHRGARRCSHLTEEPQSLCVCVYVCLCMCRSRPTSTHADVSMIYAPIRLALSERE